MKTEQDRSPQQVLTIVNVYVGEKIRVKTLHLCITSEKCHLHYTPGHLHQVSHYTHPRYKSSTQLQVIYIPPVADPSPNPSSCLSDYLTWITGQLHAISTLAWTASAQLPDLPDNGSATQGIDYHSSTFISGTAQEPTPKG